MHGRVIFPLAIVAAVAAAIAAGTGTAASARGTCSPSKSTTVAQSEAVRVYTRTATVDGQRTKVFYACAFNTRRPFRLPVNELGVDGYGPFALAGRYVAFGYHPSCGACADEANVVYVMDAVARTARHHVIVDDDDDGVKSAFTDLEATRQGSAAWIARDTGSAATVQVQKVEGSSDTPVALDSGADVELRSLALSGTTLYWTRGGVPKSATLR
ncbi:MAG TPA: hypothetical protein VF520_16240 [Thermoleophilaceae bacterium]|jgi:hypothetical protein